MSDPERRRPLRIGIVCYPTPGGSGVVAVEVAHQLAQRGHEVHVISYDTPLRLNCLMRNIQFHKVDVPQYPLFDYPPYSLALAAKLAELVCRHHIDVLHVHYAIPHAISGWLARKISGRDDLAVITTLHGTDITIIGNDPAYLPVTRFSLDMGDAVTSVSQWLAERVHEVLGCHCCTDVVYNFVDSNVYHPHTTVLEEKLRNGGDAPVLLHMSNFRPVKRVFDVVDTFLRIREQIPVKLLLVGDGPDLPEAKRRLEQSPFNTDVHFLGPQPNSEEIFPAADLFLMPSNAESFGLAALEALSSGVPVIGANVGGLTEVVRNGETGFLLPPGDTKAMAEAGLRLLQNQDEYRSFSAQARKDAIERFSPDKVIAQYEEIYWRALERVLQRGPKDAPLHPMSPCEVFSPS